MLSLRRLTPIVDLVFPPRCPLCGGVIAAQGGLCTPCWGKLAIPAEPACHLCQRPLDSDWVSPEEDASPALICAPCMASPPRHAGLTAATLYNDASRQLVLAFKHGKRIGLGHLLARMMAARLPPLSGEWLVVPVPLHRWRLWSRGFNQAALLARFIGRSTGHAVLPDGLVRPKRTPSLGKLNRRARARTLRGAITIAAQHRERIKGAQVLLVDDVVTSGATTDACLRALLRCGAATVRIACFARVLDEALQNTGPNTGPQVIAETPLPQKETPGI